MLSKQSRLIELLNNLLDKKQEFVKSYKYSLTSAVTDNDLYNKLIEDNNNIIDLSKEDLQEIVNLFDISKQEKARILHDINIVISILQMNKEEKTTIELEESQKQSLQDFINNLNILNKIREKQIPIDEPEYQKSLIVIKHIEEILRLLENKNNNQLIDDVNLIKEVVEKTPITEKQKRDIIISLMKYNREIHLEKKKDKILNKYLGQPLNEDEVISLFSKYEYDFYKLPEQIRTDILRYGELNNMNGVFDCLRGYKYPKLDEEKQANILFALLVASTFDIISNSTIHASNKGFKPEHLIKIPSALIKQKDSNIIYRKQKSEDDNTISINLNKLANDPNFLKDNELIFDLLPGSSKDFILNIEYLEDNGFDLMYILDKCKQLLILDNTKLTTNLSLFEQYGFPLDCSREKLTNQTFSALLSSNIAEIIDQFIEIHPLGFRYLKDNISCIKEYNDPLDIVFYNIYQSQKPYLGKNKKPIIVNAFKEIKNSNQTIIQLCDEITRCCKKYKYTSYREITNENKIQTTDTYQPTFDKEDEYESIIKANYCTIKENIFEHPYIEKLNKYTDIKNPLIYNFDGTRISKLKVLRILGILEDNGVKPTFDSLMYSVTYKTILNERTYSKLHNMISKEVEELI